MNFDKGQSIRSGILAIFSIFILLGEPTVFGGGGYCRLQAQQISPDTLTNALTDTVKKDTLAIATPPDSVENVRISPVYFPRFVLPDTVEGYLLANIDNFASANCPPKEIMPGALIDLTIEIVNDSLLKLVTPLFVTLLDVRADRSVLQVYREQFAVLPGGKNLIRLIANFPYGDYQLIYGFYLKEQLNEKYPRFYGRRCRFKVVETVEQ